MVFITNAKARNGVISSDKLASFLPRDSFSCLDFDPGNLPAQILRLGEEGVTNIIAAGGDGTVSAVANAILKSGLKMKLGVLPQGTFNHFAKDIGMPLKAEDAIPVLLKAKSMDIDVGQVNDRYFLNNSSLGLYPKIVRKRGEIEGAGINKTPAFIWAAAHAFRQNPSLNIKFKLNEKEISRSVPMVFIGNNKYEFSGLDWSSRKHFDEGILSVSVINELSLWKLARLLFRAATGRTIVNGTFSMFGLREFTIESRADNLDVSCDGEVFKTRPPLKYKVVPKTLTIIIP